MAVYSCIFILLGMALSGSAVVERPMTSRKEEGLRHWLRSARDFARRVGLAAVGETLSGSRILRGVAGFLAL
jgi:hypothetical protein